MISKFEFCWKYPKKIKLAARLSDRIIYLCELCFRALHKTLSVKTCQSIAWADQIDFLILILFIWNLYKNHQYSHTDLVWKNAVLVLMNIFEH